MWRLLLSTVLAVTLSAAAPLLAAPLLAAPLLAAPPQEAPALPTVEPRPAAENNAAAPPYSIDTVGDIDAAVIEDAKWVLSEAWPQWHALFGAAPEPGRVLKVILHAEQETLAKAFDEGDDGWWIDGFYDPSTCETHVLVETERQTRENLLHEGAHQFQALSSHDRAPPNATWYCEGMATLSSEDHLVMDGKLWLRPVLPPAEGHTPVSFGWWYQYGVQLTRGDDPAPTVRALRNAMFDRDFNGDNFHRAYGVATLFSDFMCQQRDSGRPGDWQEFFKVLNRGARPSLPAMARRLGFGTSTKLAEAFRDWIRATTPELFVTTDGWDRTADGKLMQVNDQCDIVIARDDVTELTVAIEDAALGEGDGVGVATRWISDDDHWATFVTREGGVVSIATSRWVNEEWFDEPAVEVPAADKWVLRAVRRDGKTIVYCNGVEVRSDDDASGHLGVFASAASVGPVHVRAGGN